MTAPVWGVPWHGQWRGSLLTLPNGTTKSWAVLAAKQATLNGVTSDIPDTFGNAHLVKVPGVPAVTRTADELTADQAAGRDWRNMASLSGGRQNLHSQNLDGWIYIDPNGDRWLARCAEFDEDIEHDRSLAFAGTLTLSRFGVFGGEAESYSYPLSFTVATWGFDTAAMMPAILSFPAKVRILRDAYKPDGSAVIGAVHARYANVTSAPNIRRVYSFLELSISGPGSAATVSIALIRPYSQVISYTPGAFTVRQYSYSQLSDPVTGAVSYEFAWGRPGRAREDWLGSECSGTVSWSWKELLAIWYDVAGNHQEVAFELTASETYNSPVLQIDPPDSLNGHLSGAVGITGSATIKLSVGGVAFDTVAASFSNSYTYAGGSVTSSLSTTVDGQTYSSSQTSALSAPETGGATAAGLIEPYQIDLTTDYGAMGLDTRRTESVPLEAGFKINIAPRGYLLQQSRQVMSLMWGDSLNPYTIRPAVTPGGLFGNKASGLAAWRYYGAWCPQTQQALTLQTSPVCFV